MRELKTESSQNGVIANTDDVIQALKDHKKNKAAEYEFIGYAHEEIEKMLSEGLIFTNELGNMIQPRNLLRNFKGALKASGIDPIRFHDMRHAVVIIGSIHKSYILAFDSKISMREVMAERTMKNPEKN